MGGEGGPKTKGEERGRKRGSLEKGGNGGGREAGFGRSCPLPSRPSPPLPPVLRRAPPAATAAPAPAPAERRWSPDSAPGLGAAGGGGHIGTDTTCATKENQGREPPGRRGVRARGEVSLARLQASQPAPPSRPLPPTRLLMSSVSDVVDCRSCERYWSVRWDSTMD